MALRVGHHPAGLGILLAILCCLVAIVVLRATASTMTFAGRGTTAHAIVRAPVTGNLHSRRR